ncbi:MAG: MbcA/ParS/Xre antitoxin family protein [Beijerinckiaceae bacterium]
MIALQAIDTTARTFSPAPISDDEAAASFRAIINLFRLWDITDEQAAVLVDMPLRTYRRWKAGEQGRITRDGKARLSNILGIHKALRLIFREPPRAYDWIKAPNAAFGGASALAIMLGGELTDLMRVRRYLDAERGSW